MGTGNIQTVYSTTIEAAKPGLRHGDEGFSVAKAAQGAVPYGYGVKRGTDPVTQATVGGGTGFLGFAQHTLAKEAAYADSTISIADLEEFQILREGFIWLAPSNTVTAGDGVIVVDATGAIKGGTAGAGETQIIGANFETSTTVGGNVALVYFDLVEAVPFVTATASLGAKSFVKSVAAATFTPLVAANGKKNYVYQVKTGTLPPGLYLNPGTGAVTGIPLVDAAATTVIFSVKDVLGNEAATTASIAITITAS